MIDLRKKGLPNNIEVAGKSYLLNTDFREWLKFGSILQQKNTEIFDLLFVINNDITALDILKNQDEFITKLIEFYRNKNVTPRQDNSSTNDIVVDYILDGEYIVASFMQAYHIDLTQCDMHWHMFKALFVGLPEDTKISQIMSMRSYRKSNIGYEEQCRKLKSIWSLPNSNVSNNEELMEEINNEFYNC